MKMAQQILGFIGFGHMAQVMCKAIENARLIPRSQIFFIRRDPSKMKASAQEFGITSTTLETLVSKSTILLICVRPRDLVPLLQDLARIGVKDKFIISVVSGLKISFYQKYLGSNIQLLRAMPNIASAVHKGATIFTFASGATSDLKTTANLLFSSMGLVTELPENLMDLATGLSGSGPGFVFRLIDAMAKAGEKGGMTRPQALQLAAQTFAGAAELILKGGNPLDLMHQIAVPGGTTEAGFEMMKKNEIEKHLQMTIEAAAHKSKQLSEEH